MHRTSYFPNYYSIDDLFVTQEMIPCYIHEDYGTFSDGDNTNSIINSISNDNNTLSPDNAVEEERTINSMVINNTNLNNQIDVGGRNTIVSGKREIIDYPLWSVLYKNDSFSSNNILLSHIFKDTFKEICDADANAINLSKINTHFYEFGRYLINYEEQENIKEIITGTCRQRLKTLKNICYESGVQLTGNDLKKEHSEKLLFQSGCKTIEMFSEWLLDRPSGIATSSMVNNHKKRKREVNLTVKNTNK